MKLYTEEQLLDICKSVAEKAGAHCLDDNWIKENCDYYGYSKLRIDLNENIKNKIDDDKIDDIELVYFKAT